ncbi:MAG: HEAT repeat domain-containing protein [Candidatus Micrarchaeia archaeon]
MRFEACEKLFFSGLEGERLYAIYAMGFTRNPKAVRLLTGVLSAKNETPVARQLAAHSLGELGDRSAVPALLSALKRSRGRVRAAIQAALAKLGVEHNGGSLDKRTHLLK